MRWEARIRARIGDMEFIWSLPRHATPTSCMLLKANAGVPQFGIFDVKSVRVVR
jgi:hypothetical protein